MFSAVLSDSIGTRADVPLRMLRHRSTAPHRCVLVLGCAESLEVSTVRVVPGRFSPALALRSPRVKHYETRWCEHTRLCSGMQRCAYPAVEPVRKPGAAESINVEAAVMKASGIVLHVMPRWFVPPCLRADGCRAGPPAGAVSGRSMALTRLLLVLVLGCVQSRWRCRPRLCHRPIIPGTCTPLAGDTGIVWAEGRGRRHAL
jgi:hypothetical protein